MSTNNYYDTGMDYLEKIKEQSVWSKHLGMLNNLHVELAFLGAFKSFHTDWNLLRVNPDDEIRIWRLACECLLHSIKQNEQRMLKSNNESYIFFVRTCLDEKIRALEWCQQILENDPTERMILRSGWSRLGV